MFPLKRTLLGAALGLLIAAPFARAQNEGVEPLARGPIHEAYAAPVDGQPAPAKPIDREPPAPIEEVPADQKPAGDNVIWMPGYFAFDDGKDDFVWVSGFWRVPPPGRSWVPGSWRDIGGQWQWTAGFWAAEDTKDVSYLPPPPATLEAGPSTPAPADDYVYQPGSWVYTSSRYVWQPGMWVVHRPGWMWTPHHYRWTPAGYVFVAGYWDYPLASRGILFAPVWIDRRYAYRPRWYFSPTIAVYDDALYGSLFVRTGYSHYVFGDYFEARFTSIGYRSWFSISFGRSYHYDPLLVYYRASYRHDPYWARGMNEVYIARYRGDIPRPPVVVNNVHVTNVNIINNPVIVKNYPNLVKTQNITNVTNVNNTVINIKNVNKTNVTNNNTTVNNTNVNNNMQKFTNLQTVSATQKQAIVADTKKIADVGKQRVSLEKNLAAAGGAKDAPKTAKLDIPKPVVSATGTNKNNAPPPPAVVHKFDKPAPTGTGNTGTGQGNSRTGAGDKPAITGGAKPGDKPPVNPPPLDKPKPPTGTAPVGTAPSGSGTPSKPPVTLPPLDKPKPPTGPPPGTGSSGSGNPSKPPVTLPPLDKPKPPSNPPPSNPPPKGGEKPKDGKKDREGGSRR